jgi:hypothetical protein
MRESVRAEVAGTCALTQIPRVTPFGLKVWQACHTFALQVKMTMHIDEDVLDEVIKITGAAKQDEGGRHGP